MMDSTSLMIPRIVHHLLIVYKQIQSTLTTVLVVKINTNQMIMDCAFQILETVKDLTTLLIVLNVKQVFSLIQTINVLIFNIAMNLNIEILFQLNQTNVKTVSLITN